MSAGAGEASGRAQEGAQDQAPHVALGDALGQQAGGCLDFAALQQVPAEERRGLWQVLMALVQLRQNAPMRYHL